MTKKTKLSKDVISIAVNDDRLRLKFSPKLFAENKVKYLALGLEDTEKNRLTAESKILEIKQAILADEFDESLDKYRKESKAFSTHADVNMENYTMFVDFLFLTGCRPSEAIGLRVCDISPNRDYLTFNGAIVLVRLKSPKAVIQTFCKSVLHTPFPLPTSAKN